jgi:hypothetical protein
MAQKAGELKDRIGDAKATVDAFSPDAKFQAFGTVVQGVAGGFSAVQGAMALVGSESAEVEKALLKVQGAIAFSQGVNTILEMKDSWANLTVQITTSTAYQKINNATNASASAVMRGLGLSVDTASTSFRVFKGVIAGLGIGLLVLALSEAVAMFSSYTNSAQEAQEATEKFNETVRKGAESQLKGEISSLARQEALAKERAINTIKDEEALNTELARIKSMYDNLRANAQKRFNNELIKNNVDRAKTENANTDLENQEVIRKSNQRGEAVLASRKKANEKLTESNQKYLADKKEKEQEAEQAEEARIKAWYERNLSEDENHKNSLQDLMIQELAYYHNNEAEKLRIKQYYQEKIDAIDRKIIQDRMNFSLGANVDLTNTGTARITKTAQETQDEANVASAKRTTTLLTNLMNRRIENEKNEANIVRTAGEAKRQTYMMIGQTMGILSGMAEQGTDLQRGLALSQVAIDTGVAISALTKNSEINPSNAFTFGGAGALQFATGLIRILANIANAKNIIMGSRNKEGGISPSGFSSAGVSTSAPVLPNFIPQAITQIDNKSLDRIGNQVVKAVVVETDITTNQRRISRIENEASF